MVDILKSNLEKNYPEFDVIGSPDNDLINQTLSRLINLHAQPMSWGDRVPPYLEKLLKRSCLIYDGKQLIPSNAGSLPSIPIDDIVAIQSYQNDLFEEDLRILLTRSHCLYGIEQPDFTKQQIESMLKFMVSTFRPKQSQIKT